MSNQVVNIESKSVLAKLMATENIHVEHKKVKTASFDVKHRVLRLPIWEKMDAVMYDGLIGHEVGHALYTPHEEWAKFATENKHLKDYANIIEDARIERKMKTKYPGMKRTFFSMYNELNTRDFFGTKDRDIESYGLADRLNVHFKMGLRAEVPFSDEELKFVNKVNKCETFEDVLELTRELGEISKAEAEDSETLMEDLPFDFDDLEPESTEDEEGESSESNTPAPSSDSNDESEEESDSSDSDSNEEEEKEEEKATADSGSAEETDEEKEEETSPTGNIAAESNETESKTNDPSMPQPETSKAFENAMETLNDGDAKEPIYLDLPTLNYKNALIPWNETFEGLKLHWENAENFSRYYDTDGSRFKKEAEDNFRSWKKDTEKVVNYMVKEFEMKQAATVHRRTSIGKTGLLDMNKLHMYKTDEDIFKRVASVKDGRNHALMMFVDWSGSMSGKMESTIKQLLTLVMFARKVGIPYRVYSFSNSSDICNKLEKPYYDVALTPTNHLKMSRLGMSEYFNEKMSSRDFNKQLMNVMFLGRSLDYTSLTTPIGHGMSSTPLNEAIVCAYDMIADFKKSTGKEKINAIFLTDGGADGNREYYDAEEGTDKSFYSYERKQYMVLRDPVTKRLLNGDRGTRQGMTASLLSGLAKRHGINVIGFHITDRKSINRHILYGVSDYDKGDALKKFCTKNGYVPLKESGYSTYFLVNDRNLDREAEFNDVERDDEGEVAKGKLRTSFRKFTGARKTNKMMLNEFVALVA